jgi:O-acetyl-ADP-ribose deacetylase (regulator of RNase III)
MRLEIVQGDLTDQHVDAIVNAANKSLLGGGGVDGAIHRRGGPAVLAECRALRTSTHQDGLPTGEAVATTAGDLPARWVIHTVGPVYGRGTSAQLAACYRNSLAVAAALGARSVAFPLISAGAYGWPIDDALRQAIDTISAAPNDGEARLVVLSAEVYEQALRAAGEVPGPESGGTVTPTVN